MIDEYSITILIPVHNEERLLAGALTSIHAFAAANVTDYELLLIESGSTDHSSAICETFASRNQHVRVFHQARRQGFGSALKLGYQQASKDWIWLVTADIPFALDEILSAARYFSAFDFIFSYRSRDPRRLSRRFQSTIYNRVINLLLGLNTMHINSAFKVLRRTALAAIELTSDGWFIDAELLYWVRRLDYRYVQLPVALVERERGVSSVRALAFFGVLWELASFLAKKGKLNQRAPAVPRPQDE